MSILNELAKLHEQFRQTMGQEPTRLYVDPATRTGLRNIGPADWPFQHLADRASLAGKYNAIAEMFGVAEVVCGHTTRFE